MKIAAVAQVNDSGAGPAQPLSFIVDACLSCHSTRILRDAPFGRSQDEEFLLLVQ
jgi:hypothetical protein